jgi:hypothetical protein
MIQLTLNFAKIAPMLTTTFEATLLQSLKTSKQQKQKKSQNDDDDVSLTLTSTSK